MRKVLLCIITLSPLLTFGQKKEVNFRILNESTEVNPRQVSLKLNGESNPKLNYDKGLVSASLIVGVHECQLSYVGFQPVSIRLDVQKDTLVSVLFEERVNQLDEVSVTSARLFERQPALGIQRISIKELSQTPILMGEIDVQRSLQTLAGVSSLGEGANGLNIRGAGVDQNLLLFDGVPIYNPTHFFGMFSVIPSDAISSIDLYKGVIPARFGGRIASVIDLKGKEPSLTNFSARGGIGLIASRLSVEAPIIQNKMGVIISARSSFTGSLLSQLEDLKKYNGRFNEVSAKLLFQPSISSKFTLNYFGTSDFTNFVGLALNPEINNSEDTEISYAMQNASATWSTYSERRQISTNFSISSAVFRPKLTSPSEVLQIEVENIVDNKKVKFDILRDFNSSTHASAGFESQLNQISPSEYAENGNVIRRATQERSIESAVYGSYQKDFSEKLKTEFGLRYSYFQNLGGITQRIYQDNNAPTELSVIGEQTIPNNEIFNTYGGFEPRVSVAYLLSPRSSLKAGVNVTRQYVQIVTNTTTPLPISRWKTSDTFIKPQVGTLYSGGYYFTDDASKQSFSVEGYFREIQNITEVKMGSNFLLKDFVETELLQGTNRAFGVELLYSKQWVESLLSMNYTYSRSRNQVTGDDLFTTINNGDWYNANVDRPHSFNANFKIQQSEIHQFSLAFTLTSGRPFTAPEGITRLEGRIYPVYLNRNNDRQPVYHRLDFAWNIENPAQKRDKYHGSWAFNIYNVYGRKNVYSIFFSNRTGALQAYQLAVLGAVIPSISYKFEFE
jgi:outer membrane cobalamin receptor